MKIEILNELENPLLKRKQFEVKIIPAEQFPVSFGGASSMIVVIF